ncbi:helix-turn-helix domain-containing protein [Thalassolituus sp. UBA2590]|mgnify:CR=1 FL=1|uniref:helix-turn-helix domain-containing protein n=1 Tax=Thalassolituus sp. UBA2590 TaxID=1947663 RepID=UPI002648EF3E|nr:helix-turn-helix transcriptional regulator [Thalassolituus sp. UBA2590]
MISKVLRLIRQFHKMSQLELAAKLDISKSYLSELESGKKTVSLALLEKYSSIFDIPASSLVFLSETLSHENPKKFSDRFGKGFSEKVITVMEWLVDKETQKKA